MNNKQHLTERLLYVLLILLFVINIGGLFISYRTLSVLQQDDTRKFKVLKSNQDTLICIVKGFTPSQTNPHFIDDCVKENRP